MNIKQFHLGKITTAFLIIFLFMTQNCFAASNTKSVIVVMKDKYFSPKIITISKGQKVTWVNKGNMNHNVSSTNGGFNSGNISPGSKYSFTFTNKGSYRYRCTLHSVFGFGMTGKVIIK